MRYLPALDGLRALAILAVVGFHARVPHLGGGFLGVDLFFVLSGYLITRVLEEGPGLRTFYYRRARRLVPPLALMLAAYLLAYPLVAPGYPHARDAAIAFFYLADYSASIAGIPNYLLHSWSLAAEEHFYLLWPLLMLRWRPGARVLLIAYIAATFWRWAWPDWSDWYFRFDTHASGLVLGCLLARVEARSFPAWPGLLVLAAAVATFTYGASFIPAIGLTVVEAAAAVAILGRPPAWLSHPVLVYLGRLSYGIYLWHYPIVRILRDSGADWRLMLLAALPCSIALAALSYHTVEAWFRRRGAATRVVAVPS